LKTTAVACVVACVAALAACGGAQSEGPATPLRPLTADEQLLALVPDGAQVVIELDLARMRDNAAVGEVARKLLGTGADTRVPGLPFVVQGSPLANARALVLAAYGVGTPQAASVTLLATKDDVPGGERVTPEIVAIGPPEWLAGVRARASTSAIRPDAALLLLRAHATPEHATGAVLHITARLSFDARVALARQTGLDMAPSRLSAWADVADDFALVVDSDAMEDGGKLTADNTKRITTTIRTALGLVAALPGVRGAGLSTSFDEPKVVSRGSWVRVIVAVGPTHLGRAVERIRAMLAQPQP